MIIIIIKRGEVCTQCLTDEPAHIQRVNPELGYIPIQQRLYIASNKQTKKKGENAQEWDQKKEKENHVICLYAIDNAKKFYLVRKKIRYSLDDCRQLGREKSKRNKRKDDK